MELREIALHSVLYCGIPAGGEALCTLDTILSESGRDSALRAPAVAGGTADRTASDT